MWFEAISLIGITLFILFMIWNLRNNPHNYYKFLLFSSVCLSPIILFGNYPVADELVFSSVAGVTLISILKKRKTISPKGLDREIFLKLLASFYFLSNSLLSILHEYNPSKLRFINIFLTILILQFEMIFDNTKSHKIGNLTRIFLHANLYIWIAYYLILRLVGIDWNYQQAITYVGSTYAAFIPAAGLILLLVAENSAYDKKLSRSYLMFYGSSVLASQIYYSRMLEFSVIVATLLALLIKRNVVSSLVLISVFFGAFLISGPIIKANYGHVSTLQVNNPSVLDVSRETLSSANFIIKPRSTDLDRSQQIRCSTRLIFTNDDWIVKLFGYGQNNHKTALRECTEEKFGPVPDGKIIRPVGYAALVTDFGIVGLLISIVLFSLVAIKLKREKGFILYIILLIQIAGWSLITNNLDHEFVYMVIFFNLLVHFSSYLKKESNTSKYP